MYPYAVNENCFIVYVRTDKDYTKAGTAFLGNIVCGTARTLQPLKDMTKIISTIVVIFVANLLCRWILSKSQNF